MVEEMHDELRETAQELLLEENDATIEAVVKVAKLYAKNIEDIIAEKLLNKESVAMS